MCICAQRLRVYTLFLCVLIPMTVFVVRGRKEREKKKKNIIYIYVQYNYCWLHLQHDTYFFRFCALSLALAALCRHSAHKRPTEKQVKRFAWHSGALALSHTSSWHMMQNETKWTRKENASQSASQRNRNKKIRNSPRTISYGQSYIRERRDKEIGRRKSEKRQCYNSRKA